MREAYIPLLINKQRGLWPRFWLMACLSCNAHIKPKRKFCNVWCQNEHTWKTKYLPRVLSGRCNHDNPALKTYLKCEGKYYCAECGLKPEWNGKVLSLQLDHIDGNSDNNFPENLRFLCPNCHTQTPTYGSKMKRKKDTKRNKYLQSYKARLVWEVSHLPYKKEYTGSSPVPGTRIE